MGEQPAVRGVLALSYTIYYTFTSHSTTLYYILDLQFVGIFRGLGGLCLLRELGHERIDPRDVRLPSS